MIVSGARLRFLANENRDVASAVTIKILNTPVVRNFQVIGQRKVQGRFVALRDSLHEFLRPPVESREQAVRLSYGPCLLTRAIPSGSRRYHIVK
jgi:hypothetical protein